MAMNSVTQPTLAATYPTAHTVDQTDDYFGTKVPDPYRWMEDVDSADVKQWVTAENALTAAHLDGVPGRDAMKARLLALTDYERFGLPHEAGGRYFFSHNTGLQNQSILYWQQGLDGERKVLIDPNTLSTDGTVALGSTDTTRDGKLIAYSVQDAGSDWQTWHVRDVATGKDLPDVVRWAKFSGASWDHDGSGFYYSAYDAAPRRGRSSRSTGSRRCTTTSWARPRPPTCWCTTGPTTPSCTCTGRCRTTGDGCP